MARKIVQIQKSRLGVPPFESGYNAVVIDSISGEEIFNNSVWGSSGGLTPFKSAISLWKSVIEKCGKDLELDNSRAPEITIDFLEKGLNPQRHFAVVRNIGRDFSLEIHLGNSKLPIYRQYYRMHWSDNLDSIISYIKNTISKYKNVSIDLSGAPNLKQYF